MSKVNVTNVSVQDTVEKKPTEPPYDEIVRNARTALARLEAYASLSLGATKAMGTDNGYEAVRWVSGAIWKLIEHDERTTKLMNELRSSLLVSGGNAFAKEILRARTKKQQKRDRAFEKEIARASKRAPK